LRADHHRIDAGPRLGAVGLHAAQHDAEAPGLGHGRPAAHAHFARAQGREHVQADDRLRLVLAEHAFLQHQRRPALLAFGRSFLGRLEDEHDLARQLLAHRGQRGCRSHQDRGVRVVAAGMHHADLLAAVFGPGH